MDIKDHSNFELLQKQWDDKKNAIVIQDARINDLIWIKCSKCEQSIQRRINHFLKNPKSCSICSGKTVVQGVNDFASHYPELLKLWDYEKNEKQPTEYSYGSGQKVYVICQNCQQSILRKVADIANFPNSCSVCSGKIVIQGVNDFATLYPELLNEWDHEKNDKLPSEISKTSKYRAWWKCSECGHSWQRMTWDKIHHHGNLCGVCAGQTLKIGINDFTTVYPKLQNEWDYKKNLTKPEETIFNSTKKVYWICQTCNTEYSRSPQQIWDRKNNRKRLCPNCLRTQISYGEQELFTFCQKIDNSIIGSYKFDPNSNKEIDIFLPKFNIGIEFNGDYWHSDKIIQPKYKMTAKAYHHQKQRIAEQEGIRLLFVWASDFYNNEEHMKQLIKQAVLINTIDPLLTQLTKDGQN